MTPERWRQTRQLLSTRRPALAAVAAGLYPELPRVAGTELLARPEWLPARPVDLDEVVLGWDPDPPAPALAGTGPAAAHVLPERAPGARYPSYADAIAALDRPALFENRRCYRLLAARMGGTAQPGAARLELGRTRYFDAVNLGHAVAHELAAAWAAVSSPAVSGPAVSSPAGSGALSLAGLPLRAAVGDPCALDRRAAIAAVAVLTLRHDAAGAASFILHWRDPAKVNHAGGVYQVLPTGIFQPVTDSPAAEQHDLSLWHCMIREFSEELLGGSEDYPTQDGMLDYQHWPLYQQLATARQAGTLRVSCLGLGVDPLTLAADILAVAVFDAGVFDQVFRDLVRGNAEGWMFTDDGSAWIPFTATSIDRFAGGAEPMQPAGAALLRLAWAHRQSLLA